MIALLCAAGAALVPARASAALVLDGAQASAGLRAFFETAGHRAGTLTPRELGRLLRAEVGVDLLDPADQAAAGLAPEGSRVLVFEGRHLALNAPVADAKRAKARMAAFLAQPHRPRSGRIERRRWLAGEPLGAPLPHDFADALQAIDAHAWLYVRGRDPVRGAVFNLDASSSGLVARGRAVSTEPLLADAPSPACAPGGLGCASASLAPGGQSLLQQLAGPLTALRPAAHAARVAARLDAIDWSSNDLSALHVSLVDPQPAAGPALRAALDLAAIAASLRRVSPLDALQDENLAAAYGVQLLYAGLLTNAGPLLLEASPASNQTALTLRLPVK